MINLNSDSDKLKFFDNLLDNCCAIFMLNKADNTYETYRSDNDFKQFIPHSGTFTDLYASLFALNKKNATNTSSEYSVFFDSTIFSKKDFSGRLFLCINGINKNYDYKIFEINDKYNIIMTFHNAYSYEAESIERQKMNSIQENYLFSMIVDLKNDTCKNANTTEISSDNQNYLNIKYSQWRIYISDMFLPDDKIMFFKMSEPGYVIEQLENNEHFTFDIKMLNMDGKYIWVRLMFKALKGFSKENPVFVYTVQDVDLEISRILKQENIIEEITKQNEHLDNINKSKSLFISNMSHEIRTPINAVLGMDEMIIRETTDKNILSYARDIQSAGKMLLSIINDILDYSKIESDKMEIIPVDYNIGTLISDINKMITLKAKEKGLTYHIKVNTQIPAVLYGDEIRIKQIIINLLTNAIKYTENGHVYFSVDFKPINNDNEFCDILVKIKDTGIGIKPEDLKVLFSEYARLEEKRNRNIEGTGLGMSIVVKLLEKMGSTLNVESTYGEGSVFSFKLRQKIADTITLKEFNKNKLSKKTSSTDDNNKKTFTAPEAKILVVDDNLVNLEVVKGLLKRTLVKVDGVHSGKDCLKKMQTETYDLVFLDHLMPEMDGIQTLSLIRKLPSDKAKIPVIALTANVMSGARKKYINCGFNDFLEKPIVPEKLEELLINYLDTSKIKPTA